VRQVGEIRDSKLEIRNKFEAPTAENLKSRSPRLRSSRSRRLATRIGFVFRYSDFGFPGAGNGLNGVKTKKAPTGW